MLDAAEVAALARRLREDHRSELPIHDETHDYLLGVRGLPSVPAGATGDIQELSRLSVKNIMPIVVDTFAQALAVDGFRSPSSDVDSEVWGIWQREGMDARQNEVYRPAVTYGASYVILTPRNDGPAEWRLRTPRQVFVEYEDPSSDLWPQFALEMWTVGSGVRKHTKAVLYDDAYAYPVTFFGESKMARSELGEPVLHGFDVCPVVRFLNDRDAEEKVRGEVRPLIQDQRAINAVNFDRLVVSRFGAFPQKWIMGWSDDDEAAVSALSAKRILAFEDPETKAGAFPAADVKAYNEILQEMMVHAALKARVSVAALTGDIANVSSETIALIDSPNQRKIAAKQRSFGESWEQVLRLAAKAEGVEVSEDAEVVWRDTEARSFAQAVDGVVKLTQAGAQIEDLLDQVPGLTQQKVDTIREGVRRKQAADVAAAVVQAARGAGQQLIAAEGQSGNVT